MKMDFRVPGVGRVAFRNPVYYEPSGFGVGRVDVTGGSMPHGHLSAVVLDKNGAPKYAHQVMRLRDRIMGHVRGNDYRINLGSGLVTNVGVLAMANEYAWANPSGAVNTILALANYHATGTGATAAAATDLKLQTWDSIAAVAGTQSLISSGTAPSYRTVATISYTGTEAVTEWGLHTSGTLSSTTGTPFTASSATSGTATGTPFTASSSTVAGQQLQVVLPGTTTVWGLVLSNTTSVLTIPAWYTVASGAAGSTPGSTEAYTLRPVLLDHKVFAAVNVLSGDSIQFTYTVTINSGG